MPGALLSVPSSLPARRKGWFSFLEWLGLPALMLGVLLAGLTAVPPAWSAGTTPLSTKPMLRVEGEMHSGVVRRVATDARNRFLATVSDDKTLRLWQLPDGRLLRTLRIPISLKNDGKLFSVAVAPNGRLVAVSGMTGWEWDGTISIHLFDIQKGEIVRTLTGIPNVVNHLAFAPSGRFLAAALSGENGIRVFHTESGRVVMEDKSYQGHSYWLDFAEDGRLVTASYDGFVRLYDKQLRLVAKRQPLEEDRPYSVEFSPDGTKIAVGLKKDPRPMVLSGKDLNPLYQVEVTDSKSPMHLVAWSADGTQLFAGGQYSKHGRRMIRRWDNGGDVASAVGNKPFVDLPASRDTLMQILPLLDGTVAFVASDPIVGVLNSKGFQVFAHERPTASFQGIAPFMRISGDGATVMFSYDPKGKNPAKFSMRNLELTLDPKNDDTLQAAVTQHKDLVLAGWDGKETLTLNGAELELKNNESPRSVAISPDGNFFALGSAYNLRLFNKAGQEVWKTPTPGTVWGVVISGDGRWVVAAVGDGTLRWYLYENGKEEVAFFPHADRKRWIAWKSTGHYAASPGAESLIGWHRNTGKDRAAEFHPASKFAQTYLKPELFKGMF